MGPRQARLSEAGSPEGRVTVTPVPAAAEGKHLQGKGEMVAVMGRDGKSLMGCSGHLPPVTQFLDPGLGYRLGNSHIERNPS